MVKSTLREIRTSLTRYLAIFAIVALGVGFFSGLKDCKASMVKTASEYLDDKNFYDYEILSSYGIDDDSVKLASEWEGVETAEGSIQIDVMASSGSGDAQALKAISLPDSINKLNLVEGRLPDSADECVVDAYSITDEGYTIGDSIILTDDNDKDKLEQFKIKEFKIVGTVNTPIYLDYQRGSTDIGNGSLYTFFFVDKSAFDLDYLTNLYVTLKGSAASLSEEHEAILDKHEDGMEDLAEAVTEARRETARKEAQEELDEKKEEYEENLEKYEKEKADAEEEISKAEDKIKQGEKDISSGKKKANKGKSEANATIKELNSKLSEVNKGIETLNSKKKSAEEGLAQANSGKAEAEKGKAELEKSIEGLKQAAQADPENAAQYEAQITELSKKLAEVEKQLVGIDATIKELKAGLKTIDGELKKADAGKKQIEDGIEQAKEGVAKAESGLKELDKQSKKLEINKNKLKSEKENADSEFEKAKKELDDAKDKLDEAQEKIDDMETGNSYALSRTQNAGYSSFDSNSSIVSNIAKIFPVFFFLIAGLVCMTTMTRMVDEQRTQIGILKALGYSNAAIVGKYMFYSGSAAFLGTAVGFFAGCKIFPMAIWNAYTMMYDFSDEVAYVIDPKLGLIALAAALLCSMGATWVSIAADFRVAPSDLIRPKTPPAGKRILMERITPLWKRISFLYKVSIRNIFRDKKRFMMMVIGVSGCTALLIAGMGIRTTISRVADHQYNEISLYDFTVVFSKNMNENRRGDFMKDMEKSGLSDENVKFMHQGEMTLLTGKNSSMDITCVALTEDNFGRFVSLHDKSGELDFPGQGEAIIVSKLQHDYGINVGDTITLRKDYREMKLKVAGVADNYVYDTIYMSDDTYKQGMGKKGDIKAAYVKLEDGATEDEVRSVATVAANYENTAAVQVNADVKDNVSKMMKSLDAVVYVVILSAALLAFIVLYNLTNINITERIREIATIKVLGFRGLEVSQYVFRENLFLTAIAAVVGIPAGKWLLKFVIDNIVVKMIYFEPRLTNTDIVLAVVMTFVFAFFVNLVMQKRLADVSMTESLKSVE